MKFYIVDCFAEEKYQGNELLVVVADRIMSDGEQQQIAREINFSETAYILSDRQRDGGYPVRIWTPNMELPFAGHPTLGAAYVIHRYLEGGRGNAVKLNLKVGQIPVVVSGDRLTMSQNAPEFGEIIQKQEVAEVFGISKDAISDEYPVQLVSTGLESVLVPLKDRESLAKIKINPSAFEKYIERHPKNYCNHLFFADMGNHTLAARCMMENYAEDPATGSANGNLAGYMVQHDYFGSNDVRYTVVQGEDMGRKSVLHIYVVQNDDDWSIEVGGNCHVVAEGDWL